MIQMTKSPLGRIEAERSHTVTLKLHYKKNLNTSSYITQIFHEHIDFFPADLYVTNKFPNLVQSLILVLCGFLLLCITAVSSCLVCLYISTHIREMGD